MNDDSKLLSEDPVIITNPLVHVLYHDGRQYKYTCTCRKHSAVYDKRRVSNGNFIDAGPRMTKRNVAPHAY
jgi:hypothetical protein